MGSWRWTIGRKLAALSATGVVVAGAIGVLSYVDVGSIQRLSDQANALTAVVLAVEVIDMEQGEVLVTERDMLLATTDADAAQANADLAHETAEINKTMSTWQGLSLPADVAEQLAQFKTAYTAYLAEVKTQMPVLQKARPGTAESAAALIVLVVGLIAMIGIAWWISRLITRPMQQLTESADKLARGDCDFTVQVSGDDEAAQALRALDGMKSNLQGVISDTKSLVASATEGQLGARVDAGRHEGDFRAIVDGINGTLDAVTDPLREVSRVLGAMESGDLTETIGTQFRGEFEDLRRAANNTVAELGEMVGEVRSRPTRWPSTPPLRLPAPASTARDAVVATEVGKLAERSQIAAATAEEMTTQTGNLQDLMRFFNTGQPERVRSRRAAALPPPAGLHPSPLQVSGLPAPRAGDQQPRSVPATFERF